MTSSGDEITSQSHSAVVSVAREARRAAELRANLGKRKALKRSRTTEPGEPAPHDTEQGLTATVLEPRSETT
jgi:hypothetical protein